MCSRGNNSQLVVVFRVKRKIVADGNAHTNLHVLLDRFGVIHRQHNLKIDAVILESLLQVAAS